MTQVLQNDWPAEIEIEEDVSGGVRYGLPIRDLGKGRRVAWAVVGAGVVLGYLLLAGPLLRVFANGPQVGNLITLLFCLTAAFFLVGLPVRFALFWLFGRCDVVLRDGRLAAIDAGGAFGRSRKWSVARLKRLQVVGLFAPRDAGVSLRGAAEAFVAEHQTAHSRARLARLEPSVTTDGDKSNGTLAFAQSLNALTGVLDDGKRIFVVAGYPRESSPVAGQSASPSPSRPQRRRRPRVGPCSRRRRTGRRQPSKISPSREWPVNEVETVRVGPSGMEVNDVPVPELQIHGTDKKVFGLLAGRDPRELTWMATHLRQALKQTRTED